ncbi:dihydroxyacetone kinase family protein [Pseudomonas oryzihabitans]|uniref:ATP-dependent dihydroxyacetone kinase n=1 Tax=Pseudomonas oryzihabitans TaxID=47885 RepID=A0AAJ2EU31_9PSED|nr:dihydroxyacetone kinase family protein [Pseudomonas psychrotolerans]MDR6232333.1 ATP-dependent dihydroxyacetone kinase [Pseudomonas psychrotolerans]MDR6353445.1 ATP-dependent dihydroxyacetone kinase [Pseudomonas psychrotolerans]
MKKLINSPTAVVRELLEGLVSLDPNLALLAEEQVLLRQPLADRQTRPVAVISGGGSGHEPAHAGYVGEGMLTAAVAGDVFTSPSVDAVLAAIRAAAGPAGALLVVKNYTGDRLNFGLAAELARSEGIPVETVLVADDAALRHTVAPEKRRGIAGTVLIHKLAGAAAAAGRPLAEVAALARAAAAELRSMGVALGACTVPAVGHPGFELADDEVEWGLGIHGEQGVERGPWLGADATVARLLDTLVEDGGYPAGTRLALLVNGLGATPPLELALVARAALLDLRRRGFEVARAWTGTFLSALDMPGCSLSLLPVDEPRLALLDAPTQARAWASDGRVPLAPQRVPAPQAAAAAVSSTPGPLSERLRAAADAVIATLLANEARLTELDSRAGDGDLGTSLARGAEAMRALPASAWYSPASALAATGQALRRAIGGSSGPFYACALVRAAQVLDGVERPTLSQWAQAFDQAVQALAELGGAQPGQRTMLDALRPAADELLAAAQAGASPTEAFKAALAKARAGADATAEMVPGQGRASYLGTRTLGIPDGGAVAVVCWLAALEPVVAS